MSHIRAMHQSCHLNILLLKRPFRPLHRIGVWRRRRRRLFRSISHARKICPQRYRRFHLSSSAFQLAERRGRRAGGGGRRRRGCFRHDRGEGFDGLVAFVGLCWFGGGVCGGVCWDGKGPVGGVVCESLRHVFSKSARVSRDRDNRRVGRFARRRQAICFHTSWPNVSGRLEGECSLIVRLWVGPTRIYRRRRKGGKTFACGTRWLGELPK
jgi:hypothetical protein